MKRRLVLEKQVPIDYYPYQEKDIEDFISYLQHLKTFGSTEHTVKVCLGIESYYDCPDDLNVVFVRYENDKEYAKRMKVSKEEKEKTRKRKEKIKQEELLLLEKLKRKYERK